jgi:hypothetical protein
MAFQFQKRAAVARLLSNEFGGMLIGLYFPPSVALACRKWRECRCFAQPLLTPH